MNKNIKQMNSAKKSSNYCITIASLGIKSLSEQTSTYKYYAMLLSKVTVETISKTLQVECEHLVSGLICTQDL